MLECVWLWLRVVRYEPLWLRQKCVLRDGVVGSEKGNSYASWLENGGAVRIRVERVMSEANGHVVWSVLSMT